LLVDTANFVVNAEPDVGRHVTSPSLGGPLIDTEISLYDTTDPDDVCRRRPDDVVDVPVLSA
jgi:hypothetical protein